MRIHQPGILLQPGMGSSSQYKVSLRSLGEVDTTAISGALGGGGHRNASSFTATVHDIDSWTLPEGSV
jgi:nanoRNase/pAp phosphatase (c-di-AMP/oligoRNAs hydrolase)